MPIIRNLAELPDAARGGAVTVGNFDGVHRGHRRIITQLVRRAIELSSHPVVFTFDPHPVRILRPEQSPPPLTWTRRKAELLARLEVDIVVAYPTDEALLNLSAEDFFRTIILDALDAKALVEGPNFYFGRHREGDVRRLGELTKTHGLALDVVEPLVVDQDLVSSSRIRRLLAAGDVALANRLLTAPYRIRGMVAHGAGRGAQLGFPTANLEAVDTLIPGHGVYAGRAYHNGRHNDAAVHIGSNPTFGEHAVKVEVHLLDREVDLYGQPLEVEFVGRIRDVSTFGSRDELAEQLGKDVEVARRFLAESQSIEPPTDNQTERSR